MISTIIGKIMVMPETISNSIASFWMLRANFTTRHCANWNWNEKNMLFRVEVSCVENC